MREEFIQSFVEELIKLSYKERPEFTNQQGELEINQQFVQPLHSFSKMIPSMMHALHFPEVKRPSQKTFSLEVPPLQPPKQFPAQNFSPSKVNLGKLTQVIYDPSVWSVECPGAGRKILVNRAGSIMLSSITLTDSEIQQVLKEFSERTRIPVVQGVFKAIFQDLLITAVISEFVGTRFVIQKRTPFAKY